MRRFAWAAAFLALTAAALGLRYLRPPQPVRADDQMVAAARAVMLAHGYAYLGLRPLEVAAGQWQTFRASHCDGAVSVVVVDPAQVNATRQLIPPGDAHEYAYLRWRSNRFDRGPILVERLAQAVQGALGASPYASSPNVLLITWPQGCGAVRGVDWSEAYRTTGPAADAAAAVAPPEA